MDAAIALAERGLVPDPLIRAGIRRLLRRRLADEARRDAGGAGRAAFLAGMRSSPIAVSTRRANEQHYEMPPEFFRLILGPYRKYSCCLWDPPASDLAGAEAAMLRLTCVRAGIEDGMSVLDLGCGWGSLSLWIAHHFPQCAVTAVSNAAPQRAFIEAACRARGLGNVRVVTADMNGFDPGARFDRVVSVEMFEHMRNWEALLERIASWLAPEGRLFVHVFCHREHAYAFETDGQSDWMARHFFTGGIMPSFDLLPSLDRHLVTASTWRVNGEHYAKTLLAWLDTMDRERRSALEILRGVHGDRLAARWLHRWRIFFLASAELFAYGGGDEWPVAHYLLAPRRTP